MAHLTVVATLKARPGREADLRTALLALVGPTRAEDGCLRYDLNLSDDEPGTFLFDEVWESRSQWDAHMQAPHLTAFAARQDELAESWVLFTGQTIA